LKIYNTGGIKIFNNHKGFIAQDFPGRFFVSCKFSAVLMELATTRCVPKLSTLPDNLTPTATVADKPG
jgi:hypothetical protein